MVLTGCCVQLKLFIEMALPLNNGIKDTHFYVKCGILKYILI